MDFKPIIEKHKKLKEKMELGKAYYKQKNTAIMNRKKLIPIKRKNGQGYIPKEDPYQSNKKIPSGFLKLQILQKVRYLINDNIQISEDEEAFTNQFGNWKKQLKRLAKKASYQIYGAWHYYLKDGELNYKFMSGEELYPIFEDHDDIPDKVIRHYTVGDKEKITVYDNQIEAHYELVGTKWEIVDAKNIITKKTVIGDDVISEEAAILPCPPFAFLFNNDEWETDLQPVKRDIDAYDFIKSDFVNDVLDFKELYFTLKNFNGQDLGEFMHQLKQVGAIPSGDDVKSHKAELPVNAKETVLSRIRKDIFESGMAVDLQQLGTGQKVTTEIMAMYELLKMKAEAFEQELQDFFRQVKLIVNAFNEYTNYGQQYEGEFIFDKSILANQLEKTKENKTQIETITLLAGLVDEKTLAEMIANTNTFKELTQTDVEELIKRLEDQTQAIQINE